MIYGYARCSTNEKMQDINRQVRELKQQGATDTTIYLEYESGMKADRVELQKLLDIVQSGDTIIATEVSRITRSTKQLCDIIELAKNKHIKLVLGTFVVDCSKELDPMTEGMLKMMGVFSELERNIISQRVKSGMENAKANIYSYPLVTSDVFKTLEDCCPDKVLITITGYNCATGELQFDAVAPEVTDVSEVIEIWKTLDIFQGVYFTGYTQNQAQDGYTVKVVCILSEHAGRQAADEN